MSYIKHRANLFLGVAELNRMQKFLEDDGYKAILLKNSASFGVVKVESDTAFGNFKVVEDTAGTGKIKIADASIAIDNVGNLIRQASISGVAAPNDSSWYWVNISHQYSQIEEGTVSIDINGNMTGVNTKFTEVLRGAPNFPSKVNFTNSGGNTLDYEIVEVVDDTTALLSGTTFTAETELTYRIVGTFTPGHVPSGVDKYPMQYDSCLIQFTPELVEGEAPAKNDGTEFFIARIKNTDGVLTIEDKRIEQYRSTAEFNLSNIIKTANPLIGVENAKFMNPGTSQDHNLLQVGFGVRSDAWTLDAPNRAITFSTGTLDGGKYKSTSQFSDNELDGWRIYFKDGSYSEIHLSEKAGSAIKCTVKEVDPSKVAAGDILTIVPAVDRVELRNRSTNNLEPNAHRTFSIEASQGFGIMELPVPTQTYSYVIEYRYLKGGEASAWLQLPSDTDNGYYDESSYDEKGIIAATTNRKTYTTNATTGFVELVRASSSYIDFIASVQTGDKFGYGSFELDNGAPGNIFEVGTDDYVQRCKGVRGSGPMTVAHLIGLKNTGAAVGNSFTFIFDVGMNDAGFTLTINTDYVSAGTPGTPIKTFTEEDFDFPHLTGEAVVIRCTYTGSVWEAYRVEGDKTKIGDIKMVSSITLADFTSGKATLGTRHQGWALCNGANNTVDLRERFVAGANYGENKDGDYESVLEAEYATIGAGAGSSSYKLTGNQSGIQNHRHDSGGYTVANHRHGVGTLDTAHGGGHDHAIRAGTTGASNWFNPRLAGTNGTNSSQQYNSSTYGTNSGYHHHTLTGSTGYLAPDVEGSSAYTTAGAIDSMDNRPAFIALGFLQRIKQSA